MWEAFGPTQKRTSTGLMPGRGSRAGERENQEDVMNHVRVKNPEKNPEKKRGTDHLWSRVSIVIKFLKTC